VAVATLLITLFALVGVGPPEFVVHTAYHGPYHTPGLGTWEKCRDPWETWQRWPIQLGLLQYVTVTVETGEIGLGRLLRTSKPMRLSARFEPGRTAWTLELVALVWACIGLQRRQPTKGLTMSRRAFRMASDLPAPDARLRTKQDSAGSLRRKNSAYLVLRPMARIVRV
jgi:hypothetical protein